MFSEKFLENVMVAYFQYESPYKHPPPPWVGTCFSLSVRERMPDHPHLWYPRLFLVTNRHNVDYTLAKGFNADKWCLTKIYVKHRDRRRSEPSRVATLEIDRQAKILVDKNPSNDIALIEYKFESPDPTLNFRCDLKIENVLSDFSYSCPLGVSQRVGFLGFPGNVWDKENHLPIYREATIASEPRLNFPIEHKPIANRILVSGMSFKGSSGSPVFASNSDTLIGVMAGHLAMEDDRGILQWDNSDESAKYKFHAGLSYFIKSEVVHNILNSPEYLEWGFGPEFVGS